LDSIAKQVKIISYSGSKQAIEKLFAPFDRFSGLLATLNLPALFQVQVFPVSPQDTKNAKESKEGSLKRIQQV
jgi:hypothetical protein